MAKLFGLKDLYETLVDDKKVKDCASAFGKGAPIMSGVVQHYERKEKIKNRGEMEEQILMEMEIKEEFERERKKKEEIAKIQQAQQELVR